MADTFNQVKDEHFLALLKRRAYMLAFPGEMIPQADQIYVAVKYLPYEHAVGYHDAEPEVLKLHVGQMLPGGVKYVTLESEDLAQFINEFFGAENA